MRSLLFDFLALFCHFYGLFGLRTMFVSRVLLFCETVVYWIVCLIGPLVLGPGPYDDIFIYWIADFFGPSPFFLILVFPDRRFLGLSLDVFDTFI